MESNSRNLLIKERPEHQRFWVVRASGGQYVAHFRYASVVAIGHVNDLQLSDGLVPQRLLVTVETDLAEAHPKRAKGSITSHGNQVRNLVADMKVGDMVLTVDSTQLSIGIVDGPARISNKPVTLTTLSGTSEMPHKLRRPVRWGPSLPRRAVPTALEMSLFAHQTVFNIDEHWASIYHLLYPCFRFRDQLFLSANITQPDELDNYAIAQFFALLSGIEAVGAALDQHGAEAGTYSEILGEFRRVEGFSLTTRAEFMSPGTVWSTAKMNGSRMLWVALIYVMVFGGDVKLVKTEGIITPHMREKAWDMILQMIETHDAPKVQGYLQLELPMVDTRPLDEQDVHQA